MTRILTLSLLFLGLAFPALAQNNLRVAAVVNNDIITTADVDGRVNLAIQGANLKPDAETLKQIRRQALDALIDEQIRLQEAARLGMTPTKEEVDQSFAKLAAQNNMSPEQFTQVLKQKPGIKASLLRQMKTQQAWANIVTKKIRNQVKVTEADITNYLTEKEKNPSKVEYQVAELFLKNTPSNQKLAPQLVQQMRSGKQRFSVLARQFSQNLEASKGGLLGWIPDGRLEPVLDEALKKLPVGEVTDPITSDRGLHILLLLEKRDILASKEGSQRLNLKQVVVPLPPNAPPQMAKEAEAFANKNRADLKDCAAMDALIAKIKSPVSRDLGEVRAADLPPPVLKAVKDLPIGKVSMPVRASDGMALFMVCGRTDTNDETVRNDVANLLGTERLGRLQQRYYRDLRAAAYVDIKQAE